MRITKVMLDATLEHINKQTKIEHTLEGANGGWKLSRTVWDTKGGENVFHTGYMPKKELYDMMQAYARGIEIERRITEGKSKEILKEVRSE